MSRLRPGDIIEITDIEPPQGVPITGNMKGMIGQRGRVRCRDRRGKSVGYQNCWEVYPFNDQYKNRLLDWWCIEDDEKNVKIVERCSVEELLCHEWEECRSYGLKLYSRRCNMFCRFFMKLRALIKGERL